MFIYFGERETDRQTEREWKTENPKQAPGSELLSTELDVGSWNS